ncbi:MAG: branched-chain amino acid ABC transporter permease [Nitriliruptorales bacterium]|nr:branched-chain amino acid ABC transporter permease [Nitriliruptorales bacterium]
MEEISTPGWFRPEWTRPAIIGGIVLVALVLVGISDVALVAVVVGGLQTGSIYALVALGLALVYKSTRVLNFAQGELGTVPAWVVFLILTGGALPDGGVDSAGLGEMLLATLAAVVVGAVLAVLINLLVIQRLSDVRPVTTLVATVGVTLAFSAVELIVFEAKARTFPRFVEGAPPGIDLGIGCLAIGGEGGCAAAGSQLAIGGARITWHMIIIVAVLIGMAVLLAAFFRTPPGVALLATSQEPYAAELYGISVTKMSTIAWAFAGAFAALGGVLGAGVFQRISPGLITTTFLVPAIVAAVLGGITSMVGAVVGGLLLGIAVSLANGIVASYGLSSVLPGPPQLATMAVLLAVLLFRPRGLFGKEA